MKFELFKDVALACDLPEHRLRRGDIVKLVDNHIAPGGKQGHSIQVFNALGDTNAVTAVPTSALEALREDDIKWRKSDENGEGVAGSGNRVGLTPPPSQLMTPDSFF